MTEQPLSLRELYDLTMECQAASTQAMRAWDWAQQVMPVFLGACRREVLRESGEGVALWQKWLASPACAFLYEVERGEAAQWRLRWLGIFLQVTEELIDERARLTPERRSEIAAIWCRSDPGLPACFGPSFWRDLVGNLSSEGVESSANRIKIPFPLVLSERIFDEVVTDVILGEFELEFGRDIGQGVFLDPAQVLIRCLGRDFAHTFLGAGVAAERYFNEDGTAIPAVRVKIATRKPSHERFFCGMVLRGGSGAGALAIGIHHLLRSLPFDSDLAVSFALYDRDHPEADGSCHPIDSADEKVLGCARQGIKRLLVAQSQRSEIGHYGFKNRVEVIGARTLAEAAAVADRPQAATEPTVNAVQDADAGSDLEGFDGPVPLSSPFYVVRETDQQFYDALDHKHSIILLKAARQMGKSSLLARGLKRAEQKGIRVVSTDFQKLANAEVADQKSFYVTIAHLIARQLNIKASLDETWVGGRSPNLNFEAYFEDHILSSKIPLVWAIDEGDRLFNAPFKNDVFALFRSWANERQGRPSSPWQFLTMAIAYATEAHLFITDINQSPFNIGTRIELRDFTRSQVADLNDRYGRHAGRAPLWGQDDLNRFYTLVGGHPYLVRRGLYAMASQKIDVREFEARAAQDDGPIADHLKRMLMLMMRSEENCQAMRMILCCNLRPSSSAFYNLRSAGVLVGESVDEARLRCPLYEAYLRAHLG